MESIFEINWGAVLVGTICYSLFCGLWHRQFAFGKKWHEAMGFKPPHGWKETSIYYIVPLLSCFATTVSLAILQIELQINTVWKLVQLGIIAGFGIAMAVVFTASIIPIMKKPLLFGMITGTSQGLGITLASFVIYFISKI